MRVLKFGGAALRDGPAVRATADIVRRHGGARPLVVVSAHAGVTGLLREAAAADLRSDGLGRDPLSIWDALRVRHRTILAQLELPGDLLDRHLRELRGILEALASPGAGHGEARHARDFVLSFGERMSARVVAAVFRHEGVAATPLDAFDLGLRTEHGRPAGSTPVPAQVGELLRSVPGVPVVTGFLALDRAGHLTTLGPNGSDLSAVWFGEAVGAEEVQLWKRVPGVLTADPELVPDARLLERLSWDDALELAVHGSGVLHPAAILPAKRARLAVVLRDVEHPEGTGTRVEGELAAGGPTALAHRPQLALIRRRLEGDRGRAEALAELYERLGDAGLEPYLGEVTGTEVRILVPDGPELARLVPRMSVPFSASSATELEVERDLSSLALVGTSLSGSSRARELVSSELVRLARRAGVALRRAPAQATDQTPDQKGDSPVFLVPRSQLASFARTVHARWLGARRSGARSGDGGPDDAGAQALGPPSTSLA